MQTDLGLGRDLCMSFSLAQSLDIPKYLYMKLNLTLCILMGSSTYMIA